MRGVVVIANVLLAIACFSLAAVFIHAWMTGESLPISTYLVMLCLVFAVWTLGRFTLKRRGDTPPSA